MDGRFYVGEWLVEPQQSRVVRGSESAKLDPKAIQVLAFLADHPNEVLTKEQIIGSVWDGAFVSDEVLTTAIWGLRKALGDDAKEPRYIQTIPRKGYRLIAPVEGVTGEESGRWEPSPYPGLSAFSQRDAAFFFGRKGEVEALWTKIHERHLLGMIGPSGAGKSSLLRAGLIPAAPEGWDIVLCQPRVEAFERLSGALDERGHPRTLWIVDQFEELFTLHDEETQRRFAALLGRAAESGLHVLLSMRDDFLIRCHVHPPLEPVFKDLTPVLPLEGAALREALVEPARASGYRFEDEALVAEILTEVSREKGALPLLAFAASKLWEKRAREGRLLTREAYLAIGGVGGALAQHAEKTLSEIGAEPVVREVFRNLTTSSGTRVPMDRRELLTVFPDRDAAERVLGKLIDARLLTSSEREVEVIHESLFSAWPRLVRWQAEDAAGAVLRDQLRQAAKLWEERGSTDDLLWIGTAYRDFAIWRERYSGRLTATEEAFAGAATRLAVRRKQRRRIAVATVVAASIAVALITSSLWRRSSAEALRAEASKLLALGQLEVESNPTAAVAYAIKSLELADTEEARGFALRVLHTTRVSRVWTTPTEEFATFQLAFSPDGEWLAGGGNFSAHLFRRDGRGPRALSGTYKSNGTEVVALGFTRRGDELVTLQEGEVRFWSVADGREIRRLLKFENQKSDPGPFVRGDSVFTLATTGGKAFIRRHPVDGGESRLLGSMDEVGSVDFDASAARMAYAFGSYVGIRSLENWELLPKLLEHPAAVLGVAFHPDGEAVAASDESGKIRIWGTSGASVEPLRVLDARGATGLLRFSPSGKWLAASRANEDGRVFVSLWNMSSRNAGPVSLMSDVNAVFDMAFDPAEEWLVTAQSYQFAFWPLREEPGFILQGHGAPVTGLQFTPDGAILLSRSGDSTVRSWPLSGESEEETRVIPFGPYIPFGLAIDPAGKNAVVSNGRGQLFVVPIAGGTARELVGFSERNQISAVGFSPDGRRVAAAPGNGPAAEKVIRIWDLESGEVQVVGPLAGAAEGWEGAVASLAFLDEDWILAASDKGLLSLDLRDGSSKFLFTRNISSLAISRSHRFGFGASDDYRYKDAFRFDLTGSEPKSMAAYGAAIAVALDPGDVAVATGGFDGIVRVGPVSGGEPHLLFGHKGLVPCVAFSPDGRWLASGGDDRTIRLWPVPDVTETPPHKRPHDEFLVMLRSWTNVRVVPDVQASTGWKLEVGPFPGWAELPER